MFNDRERRIARVEVEDAYRSRTGKRMQLVADGSIIRVVRLVSLRKRENENKKK